MIYACDFKGKMPIKALDAIMRLPTSSISMAFGQGIVKIARDRQFF